MEKHSLIKIAEEFIERSPDNYITKEIAISDSVIGMRIFDAPMFAFGAADDEYFTRLKQPSIIGEHFLHPQEWLPGAKTVISFFLPYSEEIKNSNKKDTSWPSAAWLHGRTDGQLLLNKLCLYLKSKLIEAGYNAVVPSLDERFWSNSDSSQYAVKFTSNWSERHVAFVCGLGTFGLSKGLITPKGTAGRLGSVITELYLEPNKREYQSFDEYCNMCGECAENCPANAITTENGKNHVLCSNFLNRITEIHKPRNGCGKCQVDVPCESGIP